MPEAEVEHQPEDGDRPDGNREGAAASPSGVGDMQIARRQHANRHEPEEQARPVLQADVLVVDHRRDPRQKEQPEPVELAETAHRRYEPTTQYSRRVRIVCA